MARKVMYMNKYKMMKKMKLMEMNQRNQTSLQRKLNMAAEVIEGNSAPQRPPPPPLAPPKNNPPVVVLTDGTTIRVCKGCDKAIIPDQKHYPHNMVFH